jgi:hypothetical protein
VEAGIMVKVEKVEMAALVVRKESLVQKWL